jgi:hypothetical protein
VVEVDGHDFSYFNDKSLVTTTSNDLHDTDSKYYNCDIILIDINKSQYAEDICTSVFYLIEPSTIKLNKMMLLNSRILETLRNKKIILNKSLLNSKDVLDFEYESKLKVFYNIPPLNERDKNIVVLNQFLVKLGFSKQQDGEMEKKNKILGLLVPVNESIFEHSKLLFVPLVLFWLVAYFFIKDNIDANKYFASMLISVIFSILVMICFYYTYKEIIGNSYLWVDIFDLLLSLFIGQILANHFYEYGMGIPVFISIGITFIIFATYAYLTFNPFKTPFFYDEKNKVYGINKK